MFHATHTHTQRERERYGKGKEVILFSSVGDILLTSRAKKEPLCDVWYALTSLFHAQYSASFYFTLNPETNRYSTLELHMCVVCQWVCIQSIKTNSFMNICHVHTVLNIYSTQYHSASQGFKIRYSLYHFILFCAAVVHVTEHWSHYLKVTTTKWTWGLWRARGSQM